MSLPRLEITATDAAKPEGDSGTTPFTFTVTRSGDTSAASAANWSIWGNAATDDDYAGGTIPSGTVSFAAGETSQLITVNVAGDYDPEYMEYFNVTLSSPTNASISRPTAVAHIQNDDHGVKPSITIAATDAVKPEADSGTTPFTFTVSRSGYIQKPSSAQWSVTGVGPLNGADFSGGTLPSGTVSFAPGETSKTITINVAGDSEVEAYESFDLTLFRPTNAYLMSSLSWEERYYRPGATAKGTIQNDDIATTIYAFTDDFDPDRDSRFWKDIKGGQEGASWTRWKQGSDGNSLGFGSNGQRQALTKSFDLTGGGTIGFDLIFDHRTSFDDDEGVVLEYSTDGGNTFTLLNTYQPVTEQPGILFREYQEFIQIIEQIPLAAQGSNTQFRWRQPNHDGMQLLQNFAARSLDQWAIDDITITSTVPSLHIGPGSLGKKEGESFVYTVTRTGDTSAASSVNWAVSGSEVTGADFEGGSLPSGTVSFAAGETSQTISFTAASDLAGENPEVFTVKLSSATGASIGTARAIGGIQNVVRLRPPEHGIWRDTSYVSKPEGDSGTTPFTFTVSRRRDTSAASSVNWAVSASRGHSTTGADFAGGTFPSGTVSFAPGETSKTITINVVGDTAFEAWEQFEVKLSSPTPTGTTIGRETARSTIDNDDSPAVFHIAATDAAKPEGNRGRTPFTFTVTRGPDTSAASSVNWAVSGTEVTGADFEGGSLPSGTVSFATGEISQPLTINVAGDSAIELNERFKVKLSSPTGTVGAYVGTATANGTIKNDDTATRVPPLPPSRFAEDFDPGVDKSFWKKIDQGQAKQQFNGSTGKALVFTGSGVRRALTKTFDLTAGGTIAFDLILGNSANGGDRVERGEEVVLEYTTNGGRTFRSINTYRPANHKTFTKVTETIPWGAKSKGAQFRWRQLKNSGRNLDQWAIDNISIDTTATPKKNVFTLAQIKGIKPKPIKGLSKARLRVLEPTQAGNLTKKQNQTKELKQLSCPTKDAITGPSDIKLKPFSEDVLTGFNRGEIKTLATNAISDLKPEAFDTMTEAQIQTFTSAQILSLNKKQLRRVRPFLTQLSSEQLSILGIDTSSRPNWLIDSVDPFSELEFLPGQDPLT